MSVWQVVKRRGNTFIVAPNQVGQAAEVCRMYNCAQVAHRASVIARTPDMVTALQEIIEMTDKWVFEIDQQAINRIARKAIGD